MRILVDCRCLQSPPPPRGGVGVFAEELVRALIERANAECRMQNAELHEFLLFANGVLDPREFLPRFEYPNTRWAITRWPNKIWNAASIFNIHHSPFNIPDLVFLPNLNFLPPLPNRTKLIVTVHDLSFEHFPDTFTWKQRMWHRMVQPRKLLARADAIIAVSETTKRDLVETYGIRADKIHVVYPGMKNAECGMQNVELSNIGHHCIPDQFILSVAECSPRKNLDGLVAAYEQFCTLHSELHISLVLAGAHGSVERDIRRQITRSPVRNNIHFLGSVSEDEKYALLARARCFVYPSIWEGFGFPPLEAMAAGVSVVASTGGSLPEVLGDAALLVDPLDPTAIARALERACTDDILRADLISRGRARAAKFQWEDAAMKLQKIIQTL